MSKQTTIVMGFWEVYALSLALRMPNIGRPYTIQYGLGLPFDNQMFNWNF